MATTSSAVTEVAVPAAEKEARGGSSAYLRLREAIVDGRFQPNERLVEADLARTFGAGRTAIRAALVRLDQEGLVERQPNRGARVRLVSDREALEIEEVRVALEQVLARHAATQITPSDVRNLRQILKEMTARVEAGDPLGYSELNSRFHEMIWAIADQAVASTLVANLMPNTEENLSRWLHDPQALKQGALMKLPRKLTDDEVKTLVAYLRAHQ